MSPSLEEAEIYDVIIVGAGPCGLATAARLREHAPDALFTDEEHRRYSWIGKYGGKVSLKHVRSGKKTLTRATRRPEYKLAVLDATEDGWMGRWKELFAKFEIAHLRSHMLWHVDPLDRDALLAHAYRTGRQDELLEMRHCVGREVSKHGKKKAATGPRAYGGKQTGRVKINLRDRNDYWNPSLSLFVDHCQDVVDRYNLDDDLVHKEAVRDIDYGVVRGVSAGDEKLFTVTTDNERRYAKVVVMAVGPANKPVIPRAPSMPQEGVIPQACHSMDIDEFPATIIRQRMAAGRPTNVLIVGGGLTSAQLSDLAVRRGITKVWHIMRGQLRVKYFDVDLDWMGKYKNAEHSRFWTADSDEERLGIIDEARGGGSFNFVYHKKIKKHVASGKVELRAETRLKDAALEEVDGETKWTVETEPPMEDLPRMDYIYFATGVKTNFTTLPYLQTILRKYPLKGYGGFPCLTEDLMWKDDVPLFLTGRLAALQLGPAAPNIGGAKLGAERIAWAIEDRIKPSGQEEWEAGHGKGLGGYLSGHGNMYSALVCE